MWKPLPPANAAYKKQVFERAAKVVDFIYQIGDTPALRTASPPVPVKDISTAEIQAKINYLKDCLRRYRRLTGYGRAITGVQVGIPERIAVVFTIEMDIITIINPKITKRSSKRYKYPEICMSANPIIAPVTRPAWIEFTFHDEKGATKHWKTKDDSEAGRIMNRVFQHEIDHMEGIVNIDKVDHPHDLILESDAKYYETAAFEEV